MKTAPHRIEVNRHAIPLSSETQPCLFEESDDSGALLRLERFLGVCNMFL